MVTKRAIISVANKTGIAEFARGLADLGWEIISTGGTAKLLKDNQIPVKEVDEITGFPEILGGRVKTLHPAVHGGILARRQNKSDMEQIQSLGVSPIDLVVCNLYPFVDTVSKPGVTVEDAIEEIDIGGVTLLRAAAKNWETVAAVCSTERYDEILHQLLSYGQINQDTRKNLALEVFNHTALYDSAIASYLGNKWRQWPLGFPEEIAFGYKKGMTLRYGENPHQKAAFYESVMPDSLKALSSGRGKGLSYNNINDADTAYKTVWDLPSPACVIVKHATPCGAALDSSALGAYKKALAADPVSAFGSVIAFNCEVDGPCAEALKELFIEVLIAPSFSDDANRILSAKKNLRYITIGKPNKGSGDYTLRPALGGLLGFPRMKTGV